METNAALLMLWAAGETALEARVKRRQEALALAAQDD